MLHPGNHIGAALGYEPAVAIVLLPEHLHGLPVDAAVDRHEPHALLALFLRDLEEQFCGHVHGGPIFFYGEGKGFVEGHRAHGQAYCVHHGTPYPGYVAAHAQVHERIGAVFLCDLRLLDLHGDVGDVCRGADGGVHFCPEAFADAHGFPCPVLVGGDHDLARRDALPTRAAGMPSLAATALICPVVSPLLACSNCVMWSPYR